MWWEQSCSTPTDRKDKANSSFCNFANVSKKAVRAFKAYGRAEV